MGVAQAIMVSLQALVGIGNARSGPAGVVYEQSKSNEIALGYIVIALLVIGVAAYIALKK